MDKFTAMRVFCAIVETGTFSQAAKKLGISTTATSRYLQQLEQALAAVLVQRSTRYISITSSGLEYYEHCCDILGKIQQAETRLSAIEAGDGGMLRISLPHAFGHRHLAPLLVEFHRQYPEILLDIQFTDQSVDLVREGIDMAIRISRALHPGLVARELIPIHLMCCASPDYLSRCGTPQHPNDLLRHTCLTYSYADFHDWSFYKDGEVFNVAVKGHLSSNSGDMLASAACLNEGLTLLPEFHLDKAVHTGRLKQVLSDYQLETYTAFAVYLPSARQVKKVKLLVDYLRQHFGQPGI